MTAKEFKNEVEYLAEISIKTREQVAHIKAADELKYGYLFKVFKREGFKDVQDFIEWFADEV